MLDKVLNKYVNNVSSCYMLGPRLDSNLWEKNFFIIER